MEQSPPSETNGHPSSQETPCPLWKPKVHYHAHKNPILVPNPDLYESSPQLPILLLQDPF